MNSEFYISRTNEWIFAGVWTFFMFITYGTNVPSGLFLPGMIVGCAVG
jgi:H+/Cl- antiporter ClcA